MHLTILNESANPEVVSDAVVKQIFCTRPWSIIIIRFNSHRKRIVGFAALLHSLNNAHTQLSIHSDAFIITIAKLIKHISTGRTIIL